MWQLALQTTQNPYRRTEFPVVGPVNDGTEACLAGVLKDIPPAATDVVRALQPHLRGDTYGSDPLWQIDKLCNIAKQKVISVQGASVEFQSTIAAEDIASTSVGGLGEIVMVLRAEGSAKVQVAAKAHAGVLFGDNESGIEISRREIPGLYEYVRDAVFPKFSEFF